MLSAPLVGNEHDPADRACRICLESNDNSNELNRDHLISPCSCRGTQAWVHRGCLDTWRATREDRAFSQCTECMFAYAYMPTTEGEGRALLGLVSRDKLRKIKYRLMLTRDFLGVFVAVQLCIWCIEAVLHKVDCGNWFCGGDTRLNHDNLCCENGWVMKHLFSSWWVAHTASAYYLIAVLIFFTLVGMATFCCASRSSRSSRSRSSRSSRSSGNRGGDHCDCSGCYWGGTDCNCDECGDCGDSNPCVVLLIGVAVIAIIFFALIGIFEGIVFLTAVAQRSAQRHMHIVHKRSLAQQFIVRHLSAEDLAEVAVERVRYEPSAPPMPPAPSAPPAQSGRGFSTWSGANNTKKATADAEFRDVFPTWPPTSSSMDRSTTRTLSELGLG